MFIQKIGIVSRTYRHINRYRQILSVFFRYGFGDLVDRLNVGYYLEIGMQMISKQRTRHIEKLTTYERLRMAMEELGPTFVKLGQVLSTRPDLVPVELINELSKLQDKVSPFAFAEVKNIVETELKTTIEEEFLYFDEVPLAAASIGQVHRAQLVNGDDVVVKVQRPNIRSRIEIDLEILLHLATLIEKHIEEGAIYRPTLIVKEFARTLEREIDYTVEALFAERFGQQFLGNSDIYVPRIFQDYSTKRIMTMEYIDGIKASNINRLDAEGYDRKLIASRGADLLLTQLFSYGFFHADPHPGNIFILPGNVICYLDFGMMGMVDRHSREDLADMVYAMVNRDEQKVTDMLLQIVEWDEEPDRNSLERDMAYVMELYLFKPLKEIRIKNVFEQVLGLVSRYRLRFPADKFLMIKALTTMEGLGLLLDPEFDMTEKTAPFIRKLKYERYKPKRVFDDLVLMSGALTQLAKEIPSQLRDILNQVKQGKARIGFEHRGLERLISEMDRSSNRVAFALIISSIIVGSSLIIRTDIGPHVLGYSVLGLAGFSMAAILGIWLVLAIIRSGKL